MPPAASRTSKRYLQLPITEWLSEAIINYTTVRRVKWPAWWEWEHELSPHVGKRMEDRGLNEVELRDMLERARGYRPDVVEGRWVIITSQVGVAWEVIVEPDYEDERLVIVTAYRLDDLQ